MTNWLARAVPPGSGKVALLSIATRMRPAYGTLEDAEETPGRGAESEDQAENGCKGGNTHSSPCTRRLRALAGSLVAGTLLGG